MNVISMNKISVFGGTGFIGGTFCRLYSEDVILVPRESKQFKTNEVLYFISTTTNQSVFNNLHLDINTNLSFFVDVLENCKDKDITFNFISSGFVYGNDIVDAKETDCCNPTGFYSITKRCAEQLLISFCETFGIKYRILRIGNVYGLDKTISPGKNVLGYMIQLLKENKDIKLYGGGEFLKDYMFVEDICKAIKLILEKGNVNEIYNIASGTSMTFKDIIQNAKDILQSQSNSNLISIPFPKEQEYIQIKNMTLNTDKLKDMEFVCSMDFQRGLQILCE
jgi:nucleoside-diphosphate-sugar epimerase